MTEPIKRSAKTSKGLTIVNTGKGKGKTTAALGILFRAWGQDMSVCMIQFIKDKRGTYGEHKAAGKLGIEIITTGDGFTWRSKDIDQSAQLAQHGWKLAKEKIQSDDYDIIILDEFTYPLKFGWVDFEEVKSWLDIHAPPRLHLIITGRDAPDELIEYADLVTHMENIKHPFDENIKAQRGIEF